jgi:D-amino-acid dehydrogenase
MRIIVIGGGVIGVTSAYWLRLAGHEVVLVEQEVEAGRGVSAGNGGQLSYAYVEPLAGPDLWTKFPTILLGLDSAVRMRPDLSMGSIRWGLSFLRHCVGARQSESLKGLLMLASESHRALAELLNDVPLQFDYAAAGKLILYRDAKALDGAGKLAEIKRQYGFRIEVLDRDRCLALDPALGRYGNPFAGGRLRAGGCGRRLRQVYPRALRPPARRDGRRDAEQHARHAFEDDGRPRRRCRTRRRGGAGRCRRAGQRHRRAAPGRHRRPQAADRAGEGLQHHAPARPEAPVVSLTDRAEKIVFAHLGHRLRAAAFADLDGWSPAINPKRAQQLLALARQLFPMAADWSQPTPVWAGQRPMTPSGVPLIGASGVPGPLSECRPRRLGLDACVRRGEAARRIDRIISLGRLTRR